MTKPDYEQKIADLFERQTHTAEDLANKIAYAQLYATLHLAQVIKDALDGEQ